jgi:hypothetical protein
MIIFQEGIRVFNPYTYQVFLYVPNAEKAALGQFMRDFGSELENFHFGDGDASMIGVSDNGQGPPDGWCFASYTTEAQAIAFGVQLPNMPNGTIVSAHIIGSKDFDVWLSGFGMQRIVEEDI